jgi:hypothetical protein
MGLTALQFLDILSTVPRSTPVEFIINGVPTDFLNIRFEREWEDDFDKTKLKLLKIRLGEGEPSETLYVTSGQLYSILAGYVTQSQLAEELANINSSIDFSPLWTAIANETQDRTIAIEIEETARENADAVLQSQISANNFDIENLQDDVASINGVPTPVGSGYALVSDGTDYKFGQMNTEDNPVSFQYFNTNAFKNYFHGIIEYAGVVGELDTIPDLVEAYNTATGNVLHEDAMFLQFFDSAEGGSPKLYFYDGDDWNFVEELTLNLGDFYRILNFVNNWDGSPNTAITSGTLTWVPGGSGGNFFYEQTNTQAEVGDGNATFQPDHITLINNGNILTTVR